MKSVEKAAFRTLPWERTLFVPLVCVMILGGSLVPTHAAAPEEPRATPSPSDATTNLITSVAGVERLPNSDLLLLRNGDKLTGTLLEPKVDLITGYARFSLDRQTLAGIDLEKEFEDQDRVFTVNGNHYSGFIQTATFGFRLESGTELKVRREAISKLVLHIRASEPGAIHGDPLITLRNGDVLSGKILNDPLIIRTGYAQIPVRLDTVASIEGPSSLHRSVRVVLKNGDVVQGAPAADDLHIDLGLGVPVKIYLDRIHWIRCDETAKPPTPKTIESRQRLSSALPVPDDSISQPSPRADMVPIPAGTFTMGSSTGETDRDLDEGPQTTVTISKPFWMGKYEVTQGEFQAVMGMNPSQFTGDPRRPVEKVSWQEAMDYCAKLTRHAVEADALPAGYVYRLPTEAEWEYACRAGTQTRFSYGDDPGYVDLNQYAWFTGDSDSTTHPVGLKKPNPWGLYDMHGNVWEWCLDRWSGTYPGGKATDYAGPSEGSLRVARGGSWLYDGKFCRSANRDDYGPANRCSDVGFRIVLAPAVPGLVASLHTSKQRTASD